MGAQWARISLIPPCLRQRVDFALLDFQQLHFRLQRRRRDPEFGGGAIWPRDFSPALGQSGFDHLPLLILKGSRQPTCRLRPPWLLDHQPRFVDRKRFVAAEDERPLDDVLQLTNIARPRVPLAQLQRALFDPPDSFPHLLRELPDEVLDQQRYVFFASPEGWHLDREDIQPVEQVRPESPGGDRSR